MNEISLYYREGNSDKVYQVQIEPTVGGYYVNFQYGRRGSSLVGGRKTPAPVSLDRARQIFDGLVSAKQAKGYTPGESGTPYSETPKERRQTGIFPQLLNPIDEAEMAALIDDDNWCAQPKHDGRRLLVRLSVASDGRRSLKKTVTGINRLGLTVAIPKPIEEDLLEGIDPVLLDGEAVGDKLHVFDLLEWQGRDLRDQPYGSRYDSLLLACPEPSSDTGGIFLTQTASTAKAKAALVASLRAANAEGVVFKRLDAPYVAGRPATGGSQRKLKFYNTASCFVLRANAKRSVALAILDNDPNVCQGNCIEIGNVTIPPNVPIPREHSVVEIRYLYCFPLPDGALFQPTYLGVRDDIPVEECTVDQLKFKAQ